MDDTIHSLQSLGYQCVRALSSGIESTAVFLSTHPAAAVCVGVAAVLIIARLMKSG